MKNILLLFKKDFTTSFSTRVKGNKRRDLFGIISTIILLAFLYGTFIYVFYAFAKFYLGSTFQVEGADKSRAFELATFVYAALLLVNLIVGVKQIYSALVSSNDADVLLSQPISQQELFFYKLAKILLAQIFSTAIILLPCGIVIDIISPAAGGFVYYLILFIHLFLTPLAGFAIAALIALPFNKVMRYVQRKFVLHLVLFVIVLAVGFGIYSMFLKVLTTLIQSGELKYALDFETVTQISKVAHSFYPFRFFSNMLFKINFGLSLLVVLAICAISAVATYFITKAMYTKILQQKMEGDIKIYRKKEKPPKARSPLATLMVKEFKIILRTPSYAFQYFATTFTMPFMVYICVNLMRSMVSTLPTIALVNADYEIAIFVIAMFTVLTNTFCTTNISRDGKMFGMLKTMPVSGSLIVKAKVLFCAIVSEIAVLASCIILMAVKFITVWQGAVIFVLASMLVFAEIAFATRRDLVRPNLPQNSRDEVVEGNNNVSTLTFLGLIYSIILGGGALALSLVLSILYDKGISIMVTLIFVFSIVSIVFVLSMIYLFKGLNKKFYQSEE